MLATKINLLFASFILQLTLESKVQFAPSTVNILESIMTVLTPKSGIDVTPCFSFFVTLLLMKKSLQGF